MEQEKVSEEWVCEMVAVEPITLESETVRFVLDNGEIVGTAHCIPCPAVITRHLTSPMMHIGDDDFGSEYHHALWKMQVGKNNLLS